MESCDYTGTRECKKINVNVGARNFFGNFLSFGTVTYLSKNCICLNTKMCLPLNSTIQLHFPSKENILHVPAKVSNYSSAHDFHDITRVEVLNPSREYFEFVENVTPTF